MTLTLVKGEFGRWRDLLSPGAAKPKNMRVWWDMQKVLGGDAKDPDLDDDDDDDGGEPASRRSRRPAKAAKAAEKAAPSACACQPPRLVPAHALRQEGGFPTHTQRLSSIPHGITLR